MAKTNFTKVEESLSQGLRQIDINKLLDITEGAATAEQLRARGQLIAALQYELKWLSHHGVDLYHKLRVDKAELKRLAGNLNGITQPEMDKLKRVKLQVEVYKEEFIKANPQSTDDDVVKEERRKHINKRFNIKDDWLPLR